MGMGVRVRRVNSVPDWDRAGVEQLFFLGTTLPPPKKVKKSPSN